MGEGKGSSRCEGHYHPGSATFSSGTCDVFKRFLVSYFYYSDADVQGWGQEEKLCSLYLVWI